MNASPASFNRRVASRTNGTAPSRPQVEVHPVEAPGPRPRSRGRRAPCRSRATAPAGRREAGAQTSSPIVRGAIVCLDLRRRSPRAAGRPAGRPSARRPPRRRASPAPGSRCPRWRRRARTRGPAPRRVGRGVRALAGRGAPCGEEASRRASPRCSRRARAARPARRRGARRSRGGRRRRPSTSGSWATGPRARRARRRSPTTGRRAMPSSRQPQEVAGRAGRVVEHVRRDLQVGDRRDGWRPTSNSRALEADVHEADGGELRAPLGPGVGRACREAARGTRTRTRPSPSARASMGRAASAAEPVRRHPGDVRDRAQPRADARGREAAGVPRVLAGAAHLPIDEPDARRRSPAPTSTFSHRRSPCTSASPAGGARAARRASQPVGALEQPSGASTPPRSAGAGAAGVGRAMPTPPRSQSERGASGPGSAPSAWNSPTARPTAAATAGSSAPARRRRGPRGSRAGTASISQLVRVRRSSTRRAAGARRSRDTGSGARRRRPPRGAGPPGGPGSAAP